MHRNDGGLFIEAQLGHVKAPGIRHSQVRTPNDPFNVTWHPEPKPQFRPRSSEDVLFGTSKVQCDRKDPSTTRKKPKSTPI